MPSVSVIMPAYNAGSYIAQALDSALRQTEGDLEIVVVDDGSTDATLAIAQDAASRDPRIVVYAQARSGKAAIARNRGLATARGEFIAFLDADDLYHPEKLAQQVSVLKQSPELDLVFHDVKYIDQSGAALPGTYLGRAGFHERVLSRSRRVDDAVYACSTPDLFFFMCTRVTTLHPSAVLVRRGRLQQERVLFAEDLAVGEDVDLWFRLVASGQVAYIDRVLSFYRQHSESTTKRPDGDPADSIAAHVRNYRRAEAHLDAGQRRAYRLRIAADLASTAYLYRNRGETYKARALYLESLRWRVSLRTCRAFLKTALLGALRSIPARPL